MPPFRMSLSKEQVEGKDVIPEGLYKVRFIKFNPKMSKPKVGVTPSINLNAEYEIVDSPEYGGRKLFETANMKSYNIQTEICHGFGVPLDVDPTDGRYYIPGTWDTRKDFNPDNPETFEYKGPLIGKTGKVEVAVDSYNGRSNNKIRRYICSVQDCAQKFPQIRHVSNLLGS